VQKSGRHREVKHGQPSVGDSQWAPTSAAALDRRLLESLERDFGESARRAGPWLACRPGCTECCIGPFPITRLDALRLREGLAALAAREPARAAAIVARAERAVHDFEDGFPGDHAAGLLADDEAALDGFFERHRARPCPALDPASGRCELYEARPVSCRTYGPPVSFAGEPAPPCRLCFVGADSETIERCRFEPDPAGLEQRALAELGFTAGEDWETLIAFALAR